MSKNTNNNYCIYIHINMKNNKKYIGITKNDPIKRWNKGLGYKKCPLFWKAIQKYGWNSFKHIILIQGLNKEEASNKEIELIERYNTTNPLYGYNISKGGYGINSFVLSTETRIRMAENNKGTKNPMYGKHHTEEAKQKMREKKLGKKLSEETKAKMRNKRQGKNHSNARKVLCLDDNKQFGCIRDASEYYNVSGSKISAVCRGKRKHTGGYHFKYIN